MRELCASASRCDDHATGSIPSTRPWPRGLSLHGPPHPHLPHTFAYRRHLSNSTYRDPSDGSDWCVWIQCCKIGNWRRHLRLLKWRPRKAKTSLRVQATEFYFVSAHTKLRARTTRITRCARCLSTTTTPLSTVPDRQGLKGATGMSGIVAWGFGFPCSVVGLHVGHSIGWSFHSQTVCRGDRQNHLFSERSIHGALGGSSVSLWDCMSHKQASVVFLTCGRFILLLSSQVGGVSCADSKA